MKKSIFFLLLFSFCYLHAEELIFDRVGEETQFILMLPYYDLLKLKTDNPSHHFSAVVDIFTKRDSQFHKMFDISFTVNDSTVFDGEYYPLIFSEVIPYGRKNLRLQVSTKDSGIIYEKKYELNIPRVSQNFAKMAVITNRNGMSFLPTQNKLKTDLDSLYLIQKMSFLPDSVFLVVTKDSKKTQHKLEPQKDLNVMVSDYMDDFYSAEPRLNIYYQNKLYSRGFDFFTNSNSFKEKYSPKVQLRQMRNILSQNEWASFQSVSEKRLQSEIDRYWKNHDPNPLTIINENQEVFYNRITYANIHFSIRGYKEGWDSDRGRVYLKYGAPDEIAEEVLPLGRFPAILWIYEGQQKKFYFYDIKGYGNYELKKTIED